MNVAIIPMVWSDKDTNGSLEHCAACGRRLTGKRRMVEVIDGVVVWQPLGLAQTQPTLDTWDFFPSDRSVPASIFLDSLTTLNPTTDCTWWGHPASRQPRNGWHFWIFHRQGGHHER